MSIDITSGGTIAPPSRQSLYIRMRFGETQLASGTAFLVQTHTGVALVTARHNLTGRDHGSDACLHSQGGIPDRIEIFHNGMGCGNWRNELKTEPIIEHGQPLWLEHPQLGPMCDVALLPLRDLTGVLSIPYARQQDYPEVAVRVAEPVSVVGFPMAQTAGNMMAIWCTGYIASEPSQNYANQPKFLIDCRTRRGQSGSPVIAYRSGPFSSEDGSFNVGLQGATRPLGVYTGRIHPDADIGVVWKWSVVEDLMTAFDLHVARKIQESMLKFGRDSTEFAAELKKYHLTIQA